MTVEQQIPTQIVIASFKLFSGACCLFFFLFCFKDLFGLSEPLIVRIVESVSGCIVYLESEILD